MKYKIVSVDSFFNPSAETKADKRRKHDFPWHGIEAGHGFVFKASKTKPFSPTYNYLRSVASQLSKSTGKEFVTFKQDSETVYVYRAR